MPLLPNEKPCSVLVTPLIGGTHTEYIVVGTAFVAEVDDEPNQGRLLVLRAEQNRLVLVQAESTDGMAYTLASLRGGIVAGINSGVVYFESGASAQTDGDPVLTRRTFPLKRDAFVFTLFCVFLTFWA